MDVASVGRILDREPAASNGKAARGGSKSVSPGKRVPSRAAKQARRQPQTRRQHTLAIVITVALGIAIPALTLSLSTLSSRLAVASHGWLAAAAAMVGLTVLAVSLGHLAAAIQDITHSPPAASWLLAVAVDASIVLAELATVLAPDAGCGRLACGMLIAVTVCSMALNVWAFLRGR